MKSEGIFIAERALAQHSELLCVRGPKPEELASLLGEAATRLQRTLADALPGLLGQDHPTVTCSKVEKANAAKLHKIIDPVAANMLLADENGGEVLASLGFAHALVLTDQLFGGTGEVPGNLPDRLPSSADLTLVRFSEVLGGALAAAFEKSEPMAMRSRADILGKIVPARDPEGFFVIRCTVEQGKRKAWDMVLALRERQVARLLGDGAANGRKAAPGDRRRPDAAPFGHVPMPIAAVLAEWQLPVSRVSALKPGDTISLPTPSQVPLRLADIEIARGRVGASDGSLALQLTTIAWKKDETHER